MPNYGVIDLGSNSVRLVVYEVKDDRRPVYTNKDFRSLLNDKVMAGLAAYVREAVFTQAGVERAASVLKGHLKRARYFQCKRIDVFATAVLRNCDNSAEAVAALQEAAGTRIALLSARDEAHLGFVGATCDRVIERGTLVDIGGGSTELHAHRGRARLREHEHPAGVAVLLCGLRRRRPADPAGGGGHRASAVGPGLRPARPGRVPRSAFLRHRRQRACGRQDARPGLRRPRAAPHARAAAAGLSAGPASRRPGPVRSPGGEGRARTRAHAGSRLRDSAHAACGVWRAVAGGMQVRAAGRLPRRAHARGRFGTWTPGRRRTKAGRRAA